MTVSSTALLAAETAADAPWLLENVWLVPALPALSFVIILFFGKKLPFKGAEVGITAISLSFLLALGVGGTWIQRVDNAEAEAESHSEEALVVSDAEAGLGDPDTAGIAGVEGEQALATPLAAPTAPVVEAGGEAGHAPTPVISELDWYTNGGTTHRIGTLVDGLSAMMLFVVTFISLLVHVYSTDYVAGDRRYTHFFAFLSLFSAAMLFMVLTTNILQLIVGWELVGVCSFALIGHWWEEKPNSDAALKAFLTNRVGDIGLLVGMIILFFAAGQSFDIVDINEKVISGEISHQLAFWGAISLTAAVMSKSGQFFLHTWLPDAMAGPTPVSALIHAATMVVAGVYMIARLYPVFFEGYSIAGSSIGVLGLIGATTTLAGGLLAFAQDDIKKVLAYSTVSQLGYMVLALGVGAWTAGLFHLFTHAFFKACLFLGSGSVSHAVHSFDMKKDMGGLKKWMPHTHRTMMIGSIALAGLPPLAGFWSKDEILAGTGGWGLTGGGTGGNGSYVILLVMGCITAVLTAAYTTRMVYLTFYGEYRGHGDPHESGPRITGPLYILAFMATIAGFFNLPSAVSPTEGFAHRFEHYVEPAGASYFPAIAHASFNWGLAIFSTLLVVVGVGASYLYYFRGLGPHGLTERNSTARAGFAFLKNKYYLDHLYTDGVAGGTKGPLARAAYWFNQHVIDAIVDGVGRGAAATGIFVYEKIDQGAVDKTVNGIGRGSRGAGRGLSLAQNGRVQTYASFLFAGVAALAGIFVVLV